MNELKTYLTTWLSLQGYRFELGEWYKGRSTKSVTPDKLVPLLSEQVRLDNSPRQIIDVLNEIATASEAEPEHEDGQDACDDREEPK